ncbi:pyruvate, phosphate dikinase [Balneolaceae bacterium ANBcel3]|nr:pyruvate, phosphate dikinase [Balneolaceae bacterium ANBcel3]
MSNKTKYVYTFGGGTAEGDRSMRELLGGKGANLAEMCVGGLPVPPGLTVTTEACAHYYKNEEKWPEGLREQLEEGIRYQEKVMDSKLGDPANPLLLSVRSGAAVSMPGMMDTVLNLGINDKVVEGLAEKTGNEWFAYDSYRRFIDMFADVVMGVSHDLFEDAMDALKKERGAETDSDLSTEDLKDLVDRYKALYRKETGFMFPNDPMEQLEFSINAVFGSWNSDRAIKYRKINKISGLVGTAVNVQAMVFGNMGETSGSGVLFTRNPNNGRNELYGEYLKNAQGEDVVAGTRTPEQISNLKKEMPKVYEELHQLTQKLEKHYEDMQDIEFTIQEEKLFILQTRSGKRTGPAALKIAVDFVESGLVDKKTAVSKLVTTAQLDQLLHPQFDDKAIKEKTVIGVGLPASPGAAVGKVYFTSQEAEDAHLAGEKVILARIETSPDDVGGMDASEGILTSRGGMTSHAAVVARGWGKPCVVGCDDIVINYKNKSLTDGKHTVHEGDWVSINGTTGEVALGQLPLSPPTLSKHFGKFMKWVDTFRDMKIRTNADRPEDAVKAKEFGAEGIGLCRTEHMFFEGERIIAVRRMIMSDNEEERREALAKLLPYQKEDFKGIFEALKGDPVTVRLLDPPLHEFLPHTEEDMKALADQFGIPFRNVKEKVAVLEEANPMLGHRGCRLGITFPEITEMQTRAIIEAAIEVKEAGTKVNPEIMVPLVGSGEELEDQKKVIKETAEKVFEEKGTRLDYQIGTMIEVPRAALMADEIAPQADFFSFGTNDLTQMTFGFSRDDIGKFLPEYLERKILANDPFQTLDQRGVGKLITEAVDLARVAKPDIKLGICGEHGGDPESIAFCHKQGLSYVSCSPFRVPIARLAAAQVAIKTNK